MNNLMKQRQQPPSHGPSNEASVKVIAAWHVNEVTVLLNESCWLGINGAAPLFPDRPTKVPSKSTWPCSTGYSPIPVVDLNWNAPVMLGQQPMPDQDHSVDFWRSVARTFGGNSSVIFDLYNEPYPDHDRVTDRAWKCWRDGGWCAGVSYNTVLGRTPGGHTKPPECRSW